MFYVTYIPPSTGLYGYNGQSQKSDHLALTNTNLSYRTWPARCNCYIPSTCYLIEYCEQFGNLELGQTNMT